MKIEKLHILPELERNSTNDGYTYPEKYQDKLYEMDGYYIIFRKSKLDTFPKVIFDTIIENMLEQKIEQIQSKILESSTPNIDELIQDKLNLSFTNINSVLENWTDKIESKIDLKDLQTFRNEIDVTLSEFTANITQPIISEPLDSTECSQILEYTTNIGNSIAAVREYVDQSILKISEEMSKYVGEYVDQSILKISEEMSKYADSKIIDELKIVKDNMVQIIRDNIKDLIGYTSNNKSGTLSLSRLSAMKELGFTVDDIIKLNSEGLL